MSALVHDYTLPQVPLGIIMKNETKLDDMVQIMNTLQQYVPATEETAVVQVEGEDIPFEMKVQRFHSILFAGDQLTVARARSARAVCMNSASGSGQIKGLIPVVSDWHAKLCLLVVTMHVQY